MVPNPVLQLAALLLLSLLTVTVLGATPALEHTSLHGYRRTISKCERRSDFGKLTRPDLVHNVGSRKRTSTKEYACSGQRRHELQASGGRKLYNAGHSELQYQGGHGFDRESNSFSKVSRSTWPVDTEVSALLALKRSMDPAELHLASWNTENGSNPCNAWRGVNCDSVGHIIGIHLSTPEVMWDERLNGNISHMIGDLVHLSSLNLSENSLQGPIPSELSKCRNLTLVDLSHNEFLEGEVPLELLSLPKLQTLHLSHNYFSGPVPGAVGNPCHLSSLDLRRNMLRGPIPPDLGRCRNLTFLDLSANDLNGSIPRTFGELKQLEQLLLGTNGITGNIPLELGFLVRLVILDFHGNNLVGSIPQEFGNLKELQELDLSENSLNSSIPRILGKCLSLKEVDLSYNNLIGPIPVEMGLKNLETLYIYNNTITGDIPSELGLLTNLIDLRMEYNNLTGAIPTSLGNCSSLGWLSLRFNSLSGTIPEVLGTMTSLSRLWLNQNQLTGSIPESLGKSTSLEAIFLSRNALTGTIPQTIGDSVKLEHLDLSSNALTGNVPTFKVCNLLELHLSNNQLNGSSGAGTALWSLHKCSGLYMLRLENNKFLGSLQLNFSAWSDLQHFSVSNNNFSGRIPLSFNTKNTSLSLLDFSRNGFTGEIPSTEVDGEMLSKLRVLILSHNQLRGVIPSWIGTLRSLHVLDLSHNQLSGAIPDNFGDLAGFKVTNHTFIGPGLITSTYSGRDNLGPGRSLNLTLEDGASASQYSYILRITTLMALSSNALNGTIPPRIGELFAMRYLILSNNSLEGDIPVWIENLKALEHLFLADNNLTGTIPSSLPTSLSKFNVSLTNLHGKIPTGGQFDTFSNSFYLPGNPGLCGEVLLIRPCSVESHEPALQPNAEVDVSNNVGFHVSDVMSMAGFGIGVAVGFSAVLVTSLAWASARVFVFGSHVKRTQAVSQQLQYGMFRPRT